LLKEKIHTPLGSGALLRKKREKKNPHPCPPPYPKEKG